MSANRQDLLEHYGRLYGDLGLAIAWTITNRAKDEDDLRPKRVTTEAWQTTRPLASAVQGERRFGAGASKNPALVLRPSNLLGLECDTEEGLARIAALGLPETVTVCSSKPYKRHYWFHPPPDLEQLPMIAFRFEAAGLRADLNRYLLTPPAIHPSGAVYRFLEGHAPDEIEIATMPAATYRRLITEHEAELGTERGQLAHDPEAKILEGHRRDTVFRKACQERRWTADEAEIVDAVFRWNERHCEPPLTREEVAGQVTGAMKKKGGQELVEVSSQNGTRPDDIDLEAPPEKPAAEEQDPGWVRLSAIEKQSIRFADKPLWQWGTFHILLARKGKGKGTSSASLAARFTRGEFGPKRTVVWIGTEDSPSIDIRPRVEAADGLPEHVVYVTRHLTLPEDIGWLRDLITELSDVGLVVIDPLGNHVGGINTNWDGQVREAIKGLNPLADECDVVLVGIRHLTEKESKDLRAGVLGASAWLQVPRVAIAILDDPTDPQLKHMHAFVGNRGRPGESGRQFRIEGVLLEGLEEEVTRAVWEGESKVDIEELFAGSDEKTDKAPSKSAQAREYILDVLDEEGEQESDAFDARVAKATGLKAKTVRNLRSELSDQGLVKARPLRGEDNFSVTEWRVYRTLAPRDPSPTQKSRDVFELSQIPTRDASDGMLGRDLAPPLSDEEVDALWAMFPEANE